MDVRIEESWKRVLRGEFEKAYFNELTQFVKKEYSSGIVYPPAGQIFKAFELCPFNEVKAVIVGQDPYHGPGQAHGLCFSVVDGTPFPPSLRNIFKEIHNDLNIDIPTSGNLDRWANQGVLMLNSILTVRANEAASHQNRGWELFTDAVIRKVAEGRKNTVFFLWGSYAQKKGTGINQNEHLILKSVHPSPLSAARGFFGNKQFSRCNEYLIHHDKKPVRW